ncbi:MAG: TonB-dependent receptor domain-containing protein [Polaribacter sp.]|uniref:TonB-dependent receptor domain-containing protein n=1 Tax=Polaribacter sp. TaxID=1920175 RepID=UPI0038505621
MIKKILLLAFVVFGSAAMLAQTTITGTVKDAKTGETLPGANIKVERKAVGTNTDFDGNFSLNVSDIPPFSLEISVLGYKTEKVEVTKNNQNVDVLLTENETFLDEIVVSASRTPERIMESPVTIERLDSRAIKNTSSPSFYDGLENLKGVDINSNSLTFKSVNTRGFATFANERFMQLVDGMDNSAPGLNFAVGNLLGISELDVKSVEVLPGASSALYGANAFNGIMFMRSKSAFDDQGISVSWKSGLTSQKAAGDNEFKDLNIRMAYAFSNYFAAKATLSYLEGTDWYATDYRDEVDGVSTSHSGNTAYNGLNVYGDEVGTTLDFDAIAGTPAGTLGATRVTRTGYNDVDFMNNEAKSVKFGASLNYRPLGDDRVEVIWNTKWGSGNTIYQGQNRYNIKNFTLAQHRLEVRGKNFFVRAYTTAEDAGNSYDTRFAAINVNRMWSSDKNWFQEYAGAYLGAAAPFGVPAMNHDAARAFADRGRYVPGTTEFDEAKEIVTNDPNLVTGSKFLDRTKMYHADANLNLRDYINFAEIQVGGSMREYRLDSQGTIFTDYDGPISYTEAGAYIQGQKRMLDDRLKLTASARYDKAINFKGNISPRLSLSYAAGEDKRHNFRASLQTGFRNPTAQDQYIGLDAGAGILVGTAPDNIERYRSLPYGLGIDPNLAGYINAVTGSTIGGTQVLTGDMAYNNSWTVSSLEAFALSGNPADLKKSNIAFVAPEYVTAYDVGYRGIIAGVSIDVNAYYNKYEDFIASKNAAAPLYGNVNLSDMVDLGPVTGGAAGITPIALIAVGNGDYKGVAFDSNSDSDISSYGLGIGLSKKVMNGFDLGFNYSYAKFEEAGGTDPDFEAGFNTPEHKVKVQFGKTDLFKNFGFNVNYRWQDEFLWQSSYYDGMVDARSVVDAQINYTIPNLKSVIKLGGANLGGKEYFSAPGVGATGSQFYLSWTIGN